MLDQFSCRKSLQLYELQWFRHFYTSEIHQQQIQMIFIILEQKCHSKCGTVVCFLQKTTVKILTNIQLYNTYQIFSSARQVTWPKRINGQAILPFLEVIMSMHVGNFCLHAGLETHQQLCNRNKFYYQSHSNDQLLKETNMKSLPLYTLHNPQPHPYWSM